LQNAWQNECPEKIVEYIQLEIPLINADVDSPIKDTAFLKRIGATEICGFPNVFELKNAVTGTRFTFERYKYADVPKSKFVLRRNEMNDARTKRSTNV